MTTEHTSTDGATQPLGVGSSEGLGPSAGNCSHCGFPLRRNSSGLRHYGTHTAHQASECLRLLHAEIAGLKDAVRSARADEAHCWASRVDGLTAQLREVDARYMALLKAVDDGVAMQPRTVVLDLGPNVAGNRLAEGKSGLTGLLGGPTRSEKEFACIALTWNGPRPRSRTAA